MKVCIHFMLRTNDEHKNVSHYAEIVFHTV